MMRVVRRSCIVHPALSSFALLAAIVSQAVGGVQSASPIRLTSAGVHLEVARDTGGILSFSDSGAGASASCTATTPESFRLILRNREGALRTIAGAEQAPPRWSIGAARATAAWTTGLRDTTGQGYPIDVRVTYALVGSEMRVWLSLVNRSDWTILEVHYPAVGGLARLKGEVVGSSGAVRRPLTLPFGDFSHPYPGGLPMAYVDIGGPAGLYFGAHETTARIKLLRVAELDGDLVARVVHLPYVRAGSSFSGCAAVFRYHTGGFPGAGRIYRDWFIRTFGIEDPHRDWIRRETFFQMTMLMLPEGNINYRFKDVPRLAAAARRYGLRSIQLAGWQKGGHDGGYPCYEPDPRLGSYEDLRRAIRACHAMGVRVYFFVNLQPAMLDHEWFRRELGRYEAQTSSGDATWIAGWGMGTLASRMGLTAPLMSFLDPAHERYTRRLLTWFQRLASIGADGVHVDKMFPALLDLNPAAPLPPDTATWESAIRFLTTMNRTCRAINPAWRISNECNWDRTLQVGTATWWASNMTAVKAVFPETLETAAVYQPYDFAAVNNAMREGHALMVAPYHFQRSMDEPSWRRLSVYIQKVKAIRDRFNAQLVFGEPDSPGAARVVELPSSCAMKVYRDRGPGRRVAIITNSDEGPAGFTLAGWHGSGIRTARVHVPGARPYGVMLPAQITAPAEGLVFVEEVRLAGAEITPRAARNPIAPRSPAARLPFGNTDFENGTLDGWIADPNWTVDDNSAGGWYVGWQGRRFAWSGKGGEERTGRLRSPVFTLDADGVALRVAGWSDILGRTSNRWNYVTLKTEEGEEISRAYTPNTTTFTRLVLDADGYRGRRVYIEAVDDAPESTFSMICIDDVQLWRTPPEERRPVRSAPGTIVLDSGRLRLEFGRANGTLVRVFDKQARLDMIREPRLSDNWRFSLPIRDAVGVGSRDSWVNHEGNYIRGRLQRLTSHRAIPGGLELSWLGPLTSEDGRRWDVDVVMRALRSGDGVRFETSVRNRTRHPVGEVYAPIFGGLQGFGESAHLRQMTELVTPRPEGYGASRPFQQFLSMSWLGVFGPEQYFTYPATLYAPWAMLRSERLKRGFYIGAHDPVARFKILHLEMSPGISGPRPSGNWPKPSELDGRPAGVRLSWVHVPYHPAGQTFTCAPVELHASSDRADQGAERYGAFLASQGRAAEQRAERPVRTLGRVAFDAIAGEARGRAHTGQSVWRLTDWEEGIGDDGVPTIEPAAALGGWGGLRRAAAACRDAGIELIADVRINPVSTKSPLWRSFLHRFRYEDRWGVPQTVLGWGSGRTPAETLAAGERRLFVNIGHPEMRRWLSARIADLAAAGLSGVRLEGCFPNLLDFNPRLTTTPDRAQWEAPLRTVRAIETEARRVAPTFRLLVDEQRDLLSLDRANR